TGAATFFCRIGHMDATGGLAERVRFELTCRNYPTIRFRVGAVMTTSVPLRRPRFAGPVYYPNPMGRVRPPDASIRALAGRRPLWHRPPPGAAIADDAGSMQSRPPAAGAG